MTSSLGAKQRDLPDAGRGKIRATAKACNVDVAVPRASVRRRTAERDSAHARQLARYRLWVRALSLPLIWLGLAACASTPPPATRALPRDFVDAGPAVDSIPKPQSPGEASRLIAEAVSRLREPRDAAGALARVEAVLRCDFLTDHGRADLYWLAAEAAGDVDDARRRAHLAGFLVAASVVDHDADVLGRVARARTELLASQVRAGTLGKTPERAINVTTTSEADSLVAQLGCGATGRAAYIERHGMVATHDDNDRLPVPRRLLCTENGDELVLWFRLADDP